MVSNGPKVTGENGEEAGDLADERSQEEEAPESAQIREYLDEGYTAKQLMDLGFARTSVRREVAKRMKPAGKPGKGQPGRALAKQETRPLPAETLIGELVLPEMADGTKEVFDAGVVYGMRSIVLGVKVAQDLSKMAIEQASPLIRMAQEMRASESKVAQEAAVRAGHEAAMGVAGYFEEKQPWASASASPNPMQAMLAEAMKPIVQNVIRSVTPGAEDQAGAPTGFSRRKAEAHAEPHDVHGSDPAAEDGTVEGDGEEDQGED